MSENLITKTPIELLKKVAPELPKPNGGKISFI